MPVTFGSPMVILLTLMLCLPARSLAPSPSSVTMADAWVAEAYKEKDKGKEKNKDKDKDKDDDWSADDDGLGTDTVDEAWAEKVLANPNDDRGWCQQCKQRWDHRRVAWCEVHEFPMTRTNRAIALDGGQNGGMTVMGWDHDTVRMIYRVMARARTVARAKEIAQSVRLVSHGGRVEADGPPASSTGDGW